MASKLFDLSSHGHSINRPLIGLALVVGLPVIANCYYLLDLGVQEACDEGRRVQDPIAKPDNFDDLV